MLLPVETQLSVVQLLPSEQFGALPALQDPDWQESPTVQPLLSALQPVPLDRLLQLVLELDALPNLHGLDGCPAPLA